MSWSAEQQRLLGAMGYELLVRAPMPVPDDHPALRQALARAAGGGDVTALVGDIERLRATPALKRALWPQLRALRRSH